MPHQQILPTWLSINNANFSSQSGMSDPITGQPYNSGGLNLGDYFDLTNEEAQNLSYLTNGLLFSGRYRYIQVDSGATAANVKTGTVGYARSGSTVKTVAITNAGSGQTTGTYTISATAGSGGGSGAVITVTVGSGGTITAVSVANPGYGYVSAPSFSLTAIGGSGGALQAMLGFSPNIITSYDVASATTNPALASAGLARPVIFLNAITPGNYGFVQELGTASVLGKATSFTGTANIGVVVQPTTGGVMDVPASTTAITNSSLGLALDLPIVSNLFKILLDLNAPVAD